MFFFFPSKYVTNKKKKKLSEGKRVKGKSERNVKRKGQKKDKKERKHVLEIIFGFSALALNNAGMF